MTNTNIAFVITDSRNNIAILSGVNDCEDSWYLCNNEYINKNIENISLVIDNDHYKYTILCKNDFNICIKTYDLNIDLSEVVNILDFMWELTSCDEVESFRESNDIIKAKLNIVDNYIIISEKTVALMRGNHKYITIEF